MRSIPVLCAAVLACAPQPGHSQTCNTSERAIALILDASGSMHARLPGGESRISAAQGAVKGVAELLDPKARVGLRVYGGKSPAKERNCLDSHLVVPFGEAASAGAAIRQAVDQVRAQGWTPIAYSLEQAAGDLPAAKDRAIVLVSDGKETCKGDPLVTAQSLAAKGIVIHTIGYAVDSAARMQLEGIARASRGKYFDAPDGAQLSTSLKAALDACAGKAEIPVKSAKPGKIRTAASQWLNAHAVIDSRTGKEVGKLDFANVELAVPPGVYEVRFGPATWKGIEVRAGETTHIAPATLKVSKSVAARLVDTETGDVHARLDAVNTTAVVMPGVYDLVFGGGLRWPFLELDGGKTLTLDPVEVRMGSGSRKARVLLEGRPVARFDAVTSVVRLPPGDYVVEVEGKAHPFPAPKGGEVFEPK